ncbi:hypothetical protein WA158_006589 [Blastocystis sp. Blastoise]
MSDTNEATTSSVSDEISLACIKNLCKSVLPPKTTISKEILQYLRLFAVRFIENISQDAQDLCDNQNKKSLSLEEIKQALDKNNYGSLTTILDDLSENENDSNKVKKSQKRKIHDLTPEQIQIQKEKLAKAAGEYNELLKGSDI